MCTSCKESTDAPWIPRTRIHSMQIWKKEMLEKVNKLGIGPQGFGGKTTAIGLNIETMPTHIAGMPCAVNINCHVTRHKTEVI